MTGIIVKFGAIGTSSGTAVTGLCEAGSAFNLTYVTLSSNYYQGDPDGPLPGHFPTRPMPSAGPGVVWYPQIILSGDRRQYWSCEAAAIVGAGIGSLS